LIRFRHFVISRLNNNPIPWAKPFCEKISFMSEQEVTIQEKPKPEWELSIWYYLIFISTILLLDRSLRIHFGLAMAIGLLIAYLAEYWINPPPISFVLWMRGGGFGALPFVVGLWLAPKWLSHWMYRPFAYSLSSFITLISIPWINSLQRHERPAAYKSMRNTLEWLATSLFIALSIGALMHFRPSLF
jgi:hypothetical protein